MEIHIDTKKDTKDELRKLAQFLSALADGRPIITNQGNLFSDDSSSSEATNAFAGMFGDDSPPTSATPTSPTSSGTDVFSLFNSSRENKEEEKKEIPKVELY